MIDNPLFADEIFGFHAQQAIEKALKAWLATAGHRRLRARHLPPGFRGRADPAFERPEHGRPRRRLAARRPCLRGGAAHPRLGAAGHLRSVMVGLTLTGVLIRGTALAARLSSFRGGA
ncbi:hypothetical protein [Candidatus Accumulibacter contiguus]